MNYIYDWSNFEKTSEPPFDLRVAASVCKLPTEPFPALYSAAFSGQVSYPTTGVSESELYPVVGKELLSHCKALGLLSYVELVSEALLILNSRQRLPVNYEGVKEVRKSAEETLERLSRLEPKVKTVKTLRSYLFEENHSTPAFLTPDHRPSVSQEALVEMAQGNHLAREVLEYKRASTMIERLNKISEPVHYPSFIRANEWLKSKPHPIQDWGSLFQGETNCIAAKCVEVESLVDLVLDALALEVGGSFQAAVEGSGIDYTTEEVLEALLLKSSLQGAVLEDISKREIDLGVMSGKLFKEFPELEQWILSTASKSQSSRTVSVSGFRIPVEAPKTNRACDWVADWIVANTNYAVLSFIQEVGDTHHIVPSLSTIYLFPSLIS